MKKQLKVVPLLLLVAAILASYGICSAAAETPPKTLKQKHVLELETGTQDILDIAPGCGENAGFLAIACPFNLIIAQVKDTKMEEVARINYRSQVPFKVAWSPTGHFLAVYSYRFQGNKLKSFEIFKFDRAEKTATQIYKRPYCNDFRYSTPCWLPNTMDGLCYTIESKRSQDKALLYAKCYGFRNNGTMSRHRLKLKPTLNQYFVTGSYDNITTHFLLAMRQTDYLATAITKEHASLIQQPEFSELVDGPSGFSQGLLFTTFALADESHPANTLCIHNTLSGKPYCVLEGSNPTFNPRNPYLLLYLHEGAVCVRNLKTETPIDLSNLGENISSCAWDTDGMHIYTGHCDGVLRRYLIKELIPSKLHKNFRFYAPLRANKRIEAPEEASILISRNSVLRN